MNGPFFPIPDRIGVSLLYGEDIEAPAVPAIFTSYRKDAILPEHFEVVTGVNLQFEPAESGDPFKSDVTMTTIHDCSTEGCPTYTGRVRFTMKTEALEPFRMQFEARGSFVWLCSTPQFEGRIVVSKSTSRVATCSWGPRTLQ